MSTGRPASDEARLSNKKEKGEEMKGNEKVLASTGRD